MKTVFFTLAILVAAAVCAAASPMPAAPSMQLRSIQSGGFSRYFRVHEPAGYNPQQPIPLVMAFHGGLGNARDFADQTELYVTADANDFLLVFPEGTGAMGGPPLFKFQTWNSGNFSTWPEQHGIDDVLFVRDMVAALGTEWNVDMNHIYATGHSNGGMLCYRLGIEAADLITAIAPNSAALGVNGDPGSPVPLLAMHGALDRNVPFAGGTGTGPSGAIYLSQRETLIPFARVNGIGIGNCSRAEIRGQAIRYKGAGTTFAPIHYWYLQDGGHSWPGHGSSTPGEPTNYDIDANDEIWRFFSHF